MVSRKQVAVLLDFVQITSPPAPPSPQFKQLVQLVLKGVMSIAAQMTLFILLFSCPVLALDIVIMTMISIVLCFVAKVLIGIMQKSHFQGSWPQRKMHSMC